MFESLRDMKSQIDKQAQRGKQKSDIKLGKGGIREIEFIIQALQLVYGGRDTTLQNPSIVRAAENLTKGGYLPQAVVQSLLSSYEFLRRLEHRLQIYANQQTQSLPTEPIQQLRVAYAMGFDDWDALLEKLSDQRDEVSGHFREVLNTESSATETTEQKFDWAPLWKLDLSDEDALEVLNKAGFEDPAGSISVLQQFRKEKKFLLLAAESRMRLDTFMPVLLEAVSCSDKPSLCLSRVMPLVEAVSRRTAYLVLLLENPHALEQLVLYCTVSPFISDYLCKFPVLLDELLHVLDEPPEKASLADELKLQLFRIDEDNFEEQLNCLRYFKQSHHLQVAAAEVSGKMPLMKVSDYLTYIAEVILDAVLSISWQFTVSKHGYPVHTDGKYGEPDFAIVGYGKLGGLELSYNSDLDLVFLHQAALDKDTIVSGTQKAINSRAFYLKLAQRIISVLSTYTMAGRLYEADMRLRPSGDSGLLASSIEAFKEYQLNAAWTWEHQALVRARGVAGNELLLKKFIKVRTDILSQLREKESVMEDVVSMRARMRNELKSKSSSDSDKLAFEIKQGKGGIVDIEFLVQYLVLAHSNQCQGLLTYTDNFRILEAAKECRLLDQNEMQTLINAYLDFRSASHQVALQQENLLGTAEILQTQQMEVSKIWDKLFSPVAGA
jgi:glutamate-ammonia-ligase adenylyltransferase